MKHYPIVAATAFIALLATANFAAATAAGDTPKKESYVPCFGSEKHGDAVLHWSRCNIPSKKESLRALRPPVSSGKSSRAHTPSGKESGLKFDTRKFMSVSEVRPGMRGYALTTFRGTHPQRFDIEIVGVVRKYNMGKDYILFRALDGPSVTRHLNIAHGMSGSPIYVNGRLLGAISMNIQGIMPNEPSYPKEPLALATPIEEMFDAWDPDLPITPGPISASPDTSAGSTASSSYSMDDIPLVVSGVPENTLTRLGAAMAPYHFIVMAGAGAGDAGDNDPLAQNPSLQPGCPVGVALVQGDIDFTAIGTVTYRQGNRVLLFGHPFEDLGPIDAPMMTAYMVDAFPSYQDSIMIGAPIKTVGRVFQDRPFSLGGVVGQMPHMIPVEISINDLSLHRQKVLHAQVINHPLLTPRLISYVADAAISEVHGQPGDSMATVTMDVDAEEVGHIVRTNVFFDSIAIDEAAIGDLESVMDLLSSNKFYPLAIKSVKLSVEIRNRHDTAQIDHIFLKKSKFAPGDTVDVGVALKPFKRDMVIHTIQVKIPASAPTGSYDVEVKGGSSDDSDDSMSLGGMILLRSSSEPASTAVNVAQLVKEYKERPLNNQLAVRLLLPTRAISVSGEKLSNLPPTIASVMQSNRTSGLKTERDEIKVIRTSQYIISGSQTLTITVEKNPMDVPEHGGAGAPAPSGPPPPPAEPANSGPDSGPGDEGQGSEATPPQPSDWKGEGVSDSLPEGVSAGDRSPLDVGGRVAPADSQYAETDEDAANTDITPPPPAPPMDDAGASTPGATPAAKPGTTGNVPAAAADAGSAPPAAGASAARPIGRVASIWRQSTAADFTSGTLTNASVGNHGGITLSRPLSMVAETNATYAWSVAPGPNGSVFVGTGDDGVVYSIDAHGHVTPYFHTGQLEVTSLAIDDAGNLYAGTIPNGIVYRIAPGGVGKRWYTAPEKYVTALAYDAAGKRMFVGTGGGTARVYAVPTTGDAPHGQTWLSTSEAHILSLAVDPSGVVYAGTAPNGLVYRTDLQGKSSVFYTSTDQNITGLAVADTGDVYVASSPKGGIVRVEQNGQSVPVYNPTSGPITTMLTVGDAAYAAAGNTILRIDPDDQVATFVGPTGEQYIAIGGDTSAVYAGTAAGSVYRLGGTTTPSTGQYESVVYDAGRTARWGTITWREDSFPEGVSPTGPSSLDAEGRSAPGDSFPEGVALQTRSGDVTPPDDSWSGWSMPYLVSSGETISSPSARYLQYKATLTTSNDDSLPRLHAVTVYYMPRNQPPTVTMSSPSEGDYVSKSVTIQWTANDPDHDTLTYDVAISGDGGKTWKLLKKRWRPAAPAAPATPPTGPSPAKSGTAVTTAKSAPPVVTDVAAEVDRMNADMSQHPEIPAAVRAQILAQASEVIKETANVPDAKPSAAPDAGATNLKETSFAWDSTEVPDGAYAIQVTASDKVSEPNDPLTAKAVSGVFDVANTPPAVTTDTPSIGSDRTVTLTGTATSKSAFIKAVQYAVDAGDPAAAASRSGLFDTCAASYTLTTPPLDPGDHKIVVTAFDWAGNTAVATVKVTVK